MRHGSSIVGGSLILVVMLVVNGCALSNHIPSKDSAPNSMGDSWRVPLVLRSGPVPVNMQAPTRVGHTPGLAGEVFWLSVTSLLTFGVPLLQLPDVVARHQTSVLDLPQECVQSWAQVMDRPKWLGPSEERMSALSVLAEGMKQDLDRRGQQITILIEPTAADDPRSIEALIGVATRLSASTLAVADVVFSIEPQPKQCAMLMRVSAQMHLEKPGVEAESTPGVLLTRASAVSVTQWAKDPDLGIRTLHGLLSQVGRDIVGALPAGRSTTPAR